MKRPLRTLAFVTSSVLVVAGVIAGIEWLLGRGGHGVPPFGWYQDAAGLVATPVFVRDPAGGPDARVTDPWLQRADNAPERFDAHKAAGVFRIICVGASTTAGW